MLPRRPEKRSHDLHDLSASDELALGEMTFKRVMVRENDTATVTSNAAFFSHPEECFKNYFKQLLDEFFKKLPSNAFTPLMASEFLREMARYHRKKSKIFIARINSIYPKR